MLQLICFALLLPPFLGIRRMRDGKKLPPDAEHEVVQSRSPVEPAALLMRAEELWRRAVQQEVDSSIGSMLEAAESEAERGKANEETANMPQVVKEIFKNAKYGISAFKTEDMTTGTAGKYAVCTGSAKDKPDMTLLSLVSVSSPAEYARLLHANRIKHAQMHGVAYCAYNHPLGEHLHVNRVVSKLAAIEALHDLGHSAVVWMDADAVIMNHKRDFKAVADTYPDKDIIWSDDFDEERGAKPTVSSSINSGVFIMKKSRFTRQLLEECTKYQVDVSTDLTENPDQTALLDFRSKHKHEFASRSVIIPWSTMNSWGNWYKEGDFVVHMAGGDFIQDKYPKLASQYMHDSLTDIN